MFVENNIEKESLNNIAPILSKINKSNGMHEPDEYFEQLPSIIQQKCNDLQKEPKIPSFFNPKYVIRYVMVVLLLFFGILVLIRNNNDEPKTNKNISYNDSSQDFIQNANIDDDDESLLTEALTNNSEIDIPSINLIDDIYLNTDDIINYLIDESDDNNENEF